MNAKELRPGTSADPAPVAPQDAAPPSPKWDESWDKETARLAYEHVREVYRQVDAATDVLDRKVVAVFTVASAIAAFAPVLGRFALWSNRWWLSAGAVVMWSLSAVACWRALDRKSTRLNSSH